MYIAKIRFGAYSDEFVVRTSDPVKAVQLTLKKYGREASDPVQSPDIELRSIGEVK